MAKPDTRFKRTTNWLLDEIEQSHRPEHPLPGEGTLAKGVEVSRTTIRAALEHLEGKGVIERRGRPRFVLRRPVKDDYFEVSELVSPTDQIQHVFMERISRRDLSPGQAFSEAELARESGASPPTVREFLIHFSRYGLIERKPRGGWRLRPLDASFARELADMRELLETSAALRLEQIAPENAMWQQVQSLTERHAAALANDERSFGEVRTLDREFHTMLIGLLDNRFATTFYDIVSFIFHYHYQWNKLNEKERSFVALSEHIAVLRALEHRDFDLARSELGAHLATSRQTLLQTIARDLAGLSA